MTEEVNAEFVFYAGRADYVKNQQGAVIAPCYTLLKPC
jgi:hypothetical protein